MRSSLKISAKNYALLKYLAGVSNFNEFWLGGSATYQEAAGQTGVSFLLDDYDLAFEAGGETSTSVLRKLKSKGFSVSKKRCYYLKFKKAYQIVAFKNSTCLDIAFVERLSDLGHFNWESIFWHYPSGMLFDPYKALDTFRNKQLRPIILPNEENPFILTARFLKLCARFKLDFSNDVVLANFAKELAANLRSWNSNDEFHGKYAREHGYYGVLKGVLRAENRSQFLTNMAKSHILQAMFPEINDTALCKIISSKKLQQASKVSDLTCLLENSLGELPLAHESLRKSFDIISERIRME